MTYPVLLGNPLGLISPHDRKVLQPLRSSRIPWLIVVLFCLAGTGPAYAAPGAPSAPLKVIRPGLKAPRGWTRGHWKQGWHHGRYGWWWRSRHRWYFYLTPFAPYPPYYGSGPIPVTDTPAPGFFEVPLSGAPSLSRWYCLSPPGFYPFVTSCSGGWTEVVGPPAP